jgi:hypothetical protein
MNLVILFVQLLFVFYYGYAIFVFYKLHKNTCECEKLESFKKMPQFSFLWATALSFFLYNLYRLFRLLNRIHTGGGSNDAYCKFIIIISTGFLLSFVFDAILLNFFNMMKEKNCPCQQKHRFYITNLTYVKILLNLYFYTKITGASKIKVNRIINKVMTK